MEAKVEKVAQTPKVSTTPKQEKAQKEALTKGLYQSGSPEFAKKFPEVVALQKRLEREGYGFFRFEITCSPKTKPGSKIVNITKHNAPSDWLKK